MYSVSPSATPSHNLPRKLTPILINMVRPPILLNNLIRQARANSIRGRPVAISLSSLVSFSSLSPRNHLRITPNPPNRRIRITPHITCARTPTSLANLSHSQRRLSASLHWVFTYIIKLPTRLTLQLFTINLHRLSIPVFGNHGVYVIRLDLMPRI